MDQATKPVPATYQVFINHRGKDVKRNLASLIYYRLLSFGLRVFLDREEIEMGEIIRHSIQGAIGSASVHIVIFSEHYAESKWCLDELCWILASSHKPTVIAVFCDIEPSTLTYIDTGCYAEAFKKHQNREEPMVGEWKAALKDAAAISGDNFIKSTRDYGKFLEKIVNRVLQVVRWDLLDVATYPVGLDEALVDFESKIDQKQCDTKVVGIAGIGGIGKSSLAKHIFNLKRSDFNRSCYLSNIRESDLTSLQRQLLRDLLGKDMNINNPDAGKNILRESVRGFKILIVLDDVDDGTKIKGLLDIDAVGRGSLILITCRDKDILGSSANTLLYDVKQLKREHARWLFCRHAFREPEPLEGYEGLVKEFLTICGDLPLCLIVLGEQLAKTRSINYWKRHLEMFSQGRPLPQADAVMKTLKVSYQAMNEEEQGVFLDIGCFFVGEDRELAVRVLEGLGCWNDVHYCLESLRQKYLLDFDNHVEYRHEIESRGQDGHPFLKQTLHKYGDTHVDVESYLPAVLPQGSSKIVMQNQIRELARDIARQHLRSEDHNPLRLSRSIDIVKMLEFKGGSDFCVVRGIRIPKGQNPPSLTIEIKRVRLLVLEHPIERSFFGSVIKGDLVWLRLRNFGFTSIPSTLRRRNLRVLEFQGPIDHIEGLFNQLKNGNDEIPKELRELNIDPEGEASASYDKNISSTLESVMPSLHCFLGWIGTELTCLHKIVLKNIPSVESLPIDFSNLEYLQHLDLSGLTHLTELPPSFSKLSRLQHLALRDCERLSIPMDILGEISTLEYIDLKGCVELKRLPRGIAKQNSLRYMNLLDTSLEELPLNLESLDKVEQLRIGSPMLTKLPGSVASLKGLKELILSKCTMLDDITPIEKLEHLERLEIFESTRHLPPGIVKLKNLKVLTIKNCPDLAEFSFQTDADVVNHDVMGALRDLTLTETYISNIHIPDAVCPRLEIVDLSCSFQLSQVQCFPSTLVRLSLERCNGLKILTNLSNLVHLKFLNINGCEKLETLNVEGLRSLEEIHAEECWKLQSIEAFEDLKLLNFLRVSTSLDALDFHEKAKESIETCEHFTELHEVSAAKTSRSPARLNNVLSHSAIFVCFITYRVSRNSFHVCFETSNDLAQYEYKTVRGVGSSGRMLHMYLWTKDSKLFKDERRYTNVAAYFSGDELDAEDREKGWIVTIASKSEALQVCKPIIFEGINRNVM